MGLSLQEVQLGAVEEGLALKEACWLELEAELQSTITSLEKELEQEREQHNREVKEPLRCMLSHQNFSPAQTNIYKYCYISF